MRGFVVVLGTCGAARGLQVGREARSVGLGAPAMRPETALKFDTPTCLKRLVASRRYPKWTDSHWAGAPTTRDRSRQSAKDREAARRVPLPRSQGTECQSNTARAAPLVCEHWYDTNPSAGIRTRMPGGNDTHRACRSRVPRTIANARLGEALSGRQGLQRLCCSYVPRATANARMGEALFDRQDLQRLYPLRTFRERSRPHAWAKPCLIASTYNACTPSARSENDPERTHGRSPVWRRTYNACICSSRSENDHEHTHGRSPVWRADPRCSYERSLQSRTPRVAARLGWSFLITP
jgi:hypothetical protein